MAAVHAAAAEELVESGEYEQAATRARTALRTDGSALERVQTVASALLKKLPELDPKAQGKSLHSVLALARAAKVEVDSFSYGMKLAEAAVEADPKVALQLYRIVAGKALEGDTTGTAFHERVLVQLVERFPDVLDYAEPLAMIHYEREDVDGFVALLAPHRESLKTRDKARILGEVYAGRNQFDEARQLLLPYVKGRLEGLHTAEANYEKTMEREWQNAGKQLNQGKAGNGWYEKYEGASEAQQEQMAQAWLSQRVNSSRGMKRAIEQLQGASEVVPVALELGIVLLRRAQGLSDQDARTEELEEAEQVFLSIQGVAGDSPDFKLSMGEVQYWLGKEAEGREMFEGFLTQAERAPRALLALGSTYRSLGAADEARDLLEEGYEKAEAKEIKYALASLRSLTSTDTEDEASWLEKCDPESPQVQASLASNAGDKALMKGEFARAALQYNRAIQAYQKMPKSLAALNNQGVAWQSHFVATGAAESLAQGIRLTGEARNLGQDDAILTSNYGSSLFGKICYELSEEHLDYAVLHDQPEVQHVEVLASTAEESAVLAEKAKSHRDYAACKSSLETAVLLGPKNVGAWLKLYSLAKLTRDAEAMVALADRVSGLELASERQKEELAARYSGESEADIAADLKETDVVVRARLLQAGKATGKTRALLLEQAVNSEIQKWGYVACSGDRAVGWAEEAYGLNPRGDVLARALLWRALLRLQSQQHFAGMLEGAHRAADPKTVVALLLQHDGPRAALRQDADAKRAADLIAKRIAALPDAAGADDWGLLRGLGDEAATRVGALAKDNQLRTAGEKVWEHVYPYAASTLTAAYFRAQLGERDVTKVVSRARELEIQLPF